MSFIISLAFAIASPSLSTATQRITLDVFGRPVTLVLPPCASAATVPLLISFHAWGTTAEEQEDIDGFAKLANEEQCFAVAYPQGLQRAWGPFGLMGWSWNAGGCCPNANDDEVDDVQFVQNLTVIARKQFANIDRSQLFLSGVSNGGMLANRLACELESVTAIAAVSGPLINGTSEVGKPFRCNREMPILHIHGLKDPVVPYGGCNKSWSSYGVDCTFLHSVHQIAPFPDVDEYISAWRVRNGVNGMAPVAGFSNGTVSCHSWGKYQASNVTLCTALDEGHAWPGKANACNIPMSRCTMDMDASSTILQFFSQSVTRSSSSAA